MAAAWWVAGVCVDAASDGCRCADWCRFNNTNSLFIDPGSPWQNAWIESFNGCLRDELLDSWHFDNLLEAQAQGTAAGGGDDVVRVARSRPGGVTLEAVAVDFGIHAVTLSK